MACPEVIPSLADLQALERKIAQLEQKINQCCKDDPNFARKVFAAIRGNLGEFGLIVGGLIIGGIRVDQFFTPEKLKEAEEFFALRRKTQYLESQQQAINGWKEYADRELNKKQKLVDAVERKLNKTNQTVSQISQKADKVDDLASGLARVEKTANGAASTARSASAQAGKAAGAAAGAATTASSALGKIAAFLSALSVVGGVAGLISLFGFFKATRPSLNALDSRLDDVSQGLSNNLSLITQNRNIAKRAQATADGAAKDAAAANDLAKIARRDASQAKSDAAAAQTTANAADSRARANTSEIERIKREGLPMEQGQFTTLKRQNDTAIGQNNRLIDLISGLPTAPQQEFKLPPELLFLPPVMQRIERTTGEIARNTTPDAQAANSKRGTCQAFAPSQCGDQAISRHTRPLRGLLDALGKKIDLINAALSGWINANLSAVIKKLDQIQGGMTRSFSKTWDFLKLDRVLNIYTAITATHNAYMVSNAIAQTLFQAVGNGMAFFGLKDADGNPFNVSQVVGVSLDSAMGRIFGVTTWNGIKREWKSYNRIYQAAANVMWAVQAIGDITRSLVEIAIENTGKIGNALRKSGAVLQNSYGRLTERGDAQTATKRKIDSMTQRLQDFEDKASTLEAVTGNALELNYAVTDLKQSRNDFDTTLDQELGTKENEDDAAAAASQSPEISDADIYGNGEGS